MVRFHPLCLIVVICLSFRGVWFVWLRMLVARRMSVATAATKMKPKPGQDAIDKGPRSATAIYIQLLCRMEAIVSIPMPVERFRCQNSLFWQQQTIGYYYYMLYLLSQRPDQDRPSKQCVANSLKMIYSQYLYSLLENHASVQECNLDKFG